MFEKKHRPDIVEPQLAAMIDVFSILIIFLIAGTVMGTTAVVLPPELTPPKSVSKESMLTAPQLTISQNQVRLSFSTRTYALTSFFTASPNDVGLPERQTFLQEVRQYLEQNKGKADNDLVNLVADRLTPYDRIFAVIKTAREAGIKSILFVSIADGKP